MMIGPLADNLSLGGEAATPNSPAVVAVAPLEALAPRTPEEVEARVTQLRTHYGPYLRTLPKPLETRTRVELPGTWRSKFEVASATSSVRPAPPEWWREDLDDSAWEKATVPEWRYGLEKDRMAVSCILWYRTVFDGARPRSGQRVFLVFAGVEWEAEVWLNGTMLGRHKTYYESFRFDVTALVKERNVLAVRVLSGPRFGEPIFEWPLLPDVPARDQRYLRDASKSVAGHRHGMLYAGSGFGIHREVLLETTSETCVSEVFVRADLEAHEARVAVETDSTVDRELVFEIRILPENFDGQSYAATATRRVQPGPSKQTMTVPMPGARLWQLTDPCLYRCRVVLRDGPRMIDVKDALFGCRSFDIVSSQHPRPPLPEGMFLLNGQPVFLRGTNASPSLNALAYWRQHKKLLDALLMLKAANFNALRACEHVQFPEVRDMLDRLGILSEQDQGGGHNSPAAGFTNGNSPQEVAELARAGRTLARVCYNQPSVVLLSLASETHFDPRPIIGAVREVDPERILIPISGNMKDWGTAYDYPPGFSLAQDDWRNIVDDFHCYYGWYQQKGEIWKWSRPRPPGARLVTVGEFGAEALDAYPTMAQHYPSHFPPAPPTTADTLWGHVQVQKADKAQIVGFRGRRPANLGQYIEASQNYQADVLAELTTGFRLSPRHVGGYFQFHFLDALSAHWPKSIVSHDFRPKKGFLEMAQVNQPVAPLFRIVGQGKAMEVWLANDLSAAQSDVRMTWMVENESTILVQGEKRAHAPPLDAVLVETVDLGAVPQQVAAATVSLTLADAASKPLSRYRREVFLRAWRVQDVPVPSRP
jgi:hypothetical protein